MWKRAQYRKPDGKNLNFNIFLTSESAIPHLERAQYRKHRSAIPQTKLYDDWICIRKSFSGF